MVCEHCGTVFCWDDADVGSLGGSRKRFCSKNCEVRESDKRTGYRRRKRSEQREHYRQKRQLEVCTERSKVAYGDLFLAKAAAGRVYRSKGWKLYPYLCACGQWHLTSQAPANADEGEFFRSFESPAFRDWEQRAASMR